MARAARDFRVWWGRHLLPARSDFGPGTARRPPDRQEMQRHRARALCDHWRPCWQRSGRSCIASPEPLPLGPAAAANAPLPGASGRLLCAAITAMLTYTTSELFVRGAQHLLPPEAAQKLKQGPAVARRPPRGFAAQVHQLALIWRPGKGTEDAHFLGRNPGAICGHRDQELFPQTAHRGRLASSDLLSQLDIGPSEEPFHGFTPYICNISNNGSKKASDL